MVLVRAVILLKSEAEHLGLSFEPIDYHYLKIVNTKVHFTLSFIKDKEVNKVLAQYFNPFVVAIADKYEYKQTDYIVSVSPVGFSLAKPQIGITKKISKNDVLQMLEIISEWIKENSNSDGKEVLEKLKEITLSRQQLQLDR